MILDIHSHIIPHVDDGSPDLNESIKLIKYSVASGVTDIICTPHYIPGRFTIDLDVLKQEFKTLEEECTHQGISVNLYLGQEIYISTFQDVCELFARGCLLSLNNSKFCLILADTFSVNALT